ncbi:unnamed protein product [Trypanosoma congolense IL3000]|uniref:WGS project CAEQ00000000 data, annotated contig 1556 n=1 Tax=Trypanosoma congolense (strain IL3000) TaxID=1068625 RepID=F9W732_TRYCI|nr:unnamed protein product [Trypanosoma congolense IL3000]
MGCGASKPSVEHCNKSQLELEQANAQQLSCPIADDSPTPPAPEVPQASEMDTGVNKRSSEVSLSSKFPSEGASNLPYRMSRGISDADSDLRNGSGMLSNDECAASDFATFSHKGYRCLYCHREGDVGVCNSSFPALVCEDCSCHNGWEQEAGQTSDNIQTKTNGSNAAEEHSNKSEGFRSSFAGTACEHRNVCDDQYERCSRCTRQRRRRISRERICIRYTSEAIYVDDVRCSHTRTGGFES